MQVLFYAAYGIFVLLGGWFVFGGLAGRPYLGGAPFWIARLTLGAGALWSILLLRWAYRLGEVQGRWAAGLGVVAAAVAGFYALQLLGMFVGLAFAAARGGVYSGTEH